MSSINLHIDGEEFQKFQELVKSIEAAETDNFLDLAKILNRDPKKDFAGANLCGIDLSGLKLNEAIFSQTDFMEANLRGVSLIKADLSGANLSGADLSGADLSGANLSGADLSRADLGKANLNGADLIEANLHKTNFYETSFRGANLDEANLGKVEEWIELAQDESEQAMASHPSSQLQRGNIDPSVAIFQKWMNLDAVSIRQFGAERLAVIKRQIMEYGKRKAVENRLTELSREARRNPPSNTKLAVKDDWRKAKGWLKADQNDIEKMPDDIKEIMHEQVKAHAINSQAKKRISDLSRKKPLSLEIKIIVKVVVTLVGAITFSATPGLISDALGQRSLTTSSALAGGAIAAFLLDNRAIRVFTGFRLKKNTNAARDIISREEVDSRNTNEFVKDFYQTKRDLLGEIEGHHDKEPETTAVLTASSLAIIEMATVFWVVLPAGPMVAILAAGFPISIILAAAAAQSEHFDLPEQNLELSEKYHDILRTSQNIQAIDDPKEYDRLLADHIFRFISSSSIAGRYKNQEMARADFDIQYFQNRIQNLREEYRQVRRIRRQEHKEELEKLYASFPIEKVATQGLSQPEIDERQEAANSRREKRLDMKTQKLEAELNDDLVDIENRYEEAMEACRTRIDNAVKDFNNANGPVRQNLDRLYQDDSIDR